MTSGNGNHSYHAVIQEVLNEARKQNLAVDARLPSVRELARKFEVAKGTVEQALRELVREGLCYAVSRKGVYLARELPPAEAESSTICLVLQYERYSEETNPFYRSLFEGAEAAAVSARHNVLTLHEWRQKNPLQKTREIEQFRQQLAGILGLAIYDERDCLRIRQSGLPAVIVDNETVDLGLDCVVIDNTAVTTELCARVLDAAPGRVFYADFARVHDYDPAVRERAAAFEAAVKAAGRDAGSESRLFLGWPEEPFREVPGAVRALASSGDMPAVVCSDETAARHFLGGLGPNDPRPGRDFLLAYLGFLRPQHANMLEVPALIGAVDFSELGRQGMLLLEERISSGPGRAVRRTVGGRVVEWKGPEGE